MSSIFHANCKNINTKKLNIIACGSIAITFLADRFYHKIYIPSLLVRLPRFPSSNYIKANYFTAHGKHKLLINDRRDPIIFQWIILAYLKSRANFDIPAIQLISLATINYFIRNKEKHFLIPCSFLLIGNIIYTSAYYLQSLRMSILIDYIKDGNWKVYENFGKLMFSDQHGASYLFPFASFGIFMCIMGNVIAWPLLGSIWSVFMISVYFKHWKKIWT